jgi:pSer/pThr/pTyr-binding forkhead associated (FHA) protein
VSAELAYTAVWYVDCKVSEKLTASVFKERIPQIPKRLYECVDSENRIHNVFQTTTRTRLSKYAAHPSHAVRIRNHAPVTERQVCQLRKHPAAGILCFACNLATALICILHAYMDKG